VHINPYFLRLNFSNSLLEDDGSSARYDAGSGYLTVTLTKAVKGQEFQDLDLLAKLLVPRSQRPREPKIEVVRSEGPLQDVTDGLVEKTEKLSLEQKEILEGDSLSLFLLHAPVNTTRSCRKRLAISTEITRTSPHALLIRRKAIWIS
jgi:hypothetical protein